MALTDSDALIARLPHRPPFRFVDEVDECEPAVSVEGPVPGHRRRGAASQGHFPGNPILPGVIQLEALAQAGAIALLADGRYEGKLALFGGVEKVRFRRVVRPGDELAAHGRHRAAERTRRLGPGPATVDGDAACEARMFFAIS